MLERERNRADAARESENRRIRREQDRKRAEEDAREKPPVTQRDIEDLF